MQGYSSAPQRLCRPCRPVPSGRHWLHEHAFRPREHRCPRAAPNGLLEDPERRDHQSALPAQDRRTGQPRDHVDRHVCPRRGGAGRKDSRAQRHAAQEHHSASLHHPVSHPDGRCQPQGDGRVALTGLRRCGLQRPHCGHHCAHRRHGYGRQSDRKALHPRQEHGRSRPSCVARPRRTAGHGQSHSRG